VKKLKMSTSAPRICLHGVNRNGFAFIYFACFTASGSPCSRNFRLHKLFISSILPVISQVICSDSGRFEYTQGQSRWQDPINHLYNTRDMNYKNCAFLYSNCTSVIALGGVPLVSLRTFKDARPHSSRTLRQPTLPLPPALALSLSLSLSLSSPLYKEFL